MNSKQLIEAKLKERNAGNPDRASVIHMINEGYDYFEIHIISDIPLSEIRNIADEYFNSAD